MLLRAADRFWFAPMPAERLAILRLLIGAFSTIYAIVRSWHMARAAFFDPHVFRPVGLVTILDAPLPPAIVIGVVVVMLPLGVAFTLGWRFRITGPAFAFALLWATNYRTSWGMIFHTENLMCMHVLVLALAPAADALSLDAGRRGSPCRGRVDAAYGWPVRLICAITGIAYFMAGYAKLRNTGTVWMAGDTLRFQIAYDTVKKIKLGDFYSPFGAWTLRFPAIFPPLAFLTVVAEVGAPLAVFNKWIARVIMPLLFLFHWGVALLMAIAFPYPLCGVAFASFMPVERLLKWSRLTRVWTFFGEDDPASITW